MEVSSYFFLKMKEFLDNSDVSISEFYPEQDIKMFGERNERWAYVLPAFNGRFAGYPAAHIFSDIYENLVEEVEQNMRHPIENEKIIKYLRDIFSFCEQKLNGIILKQVNGEYEYELTFVKYLNTSFEEIGKNKKGSDYFETTKYIHDSLMVIASYTHSNIEKLKKDSQSKRKSRKDFSSFILESKYLNNKEIFKDFKDELIDYKFIDPNTKMDDFRAIFENKSIKNPIVWIGDKCALKFFILELSKGFFSAEISDIWKITSKCFVFKDKIKLTVNDFYSIHLPEENTENFEKIWGIINLLKKLRGNRS
jgi:hypothetical protein